MSIEQNYSVFSVKGGSFVEDIRHKLKIVVERSGYKKACIAKAMGITPQKLSAVLALRRRLDANEFLKFCEFVRLTPTEVANIDKKGVSNAQD
jgi:hypothetical protein